MQNEEQIIKVLQSCLLYPYWLILDIADDIDSATIDTREDLVETLKLIDSKWMSDTSLLLDDEFIDYLYSNLQEIYNA